MRTVPHRRKGKVVVKKAAAVVGTLAVVAFGSAGIASADPDVPTPPVVPTIQQQAPPVQKVPQAPAVPQAPVVPQVPVAPQAPSQAPRSQVPQVPTPVLPQVPVVQPSSQPVEQLPVVVPQKPAEQPKPAPQEPPVTTLAPAPQQQPEPQAPRRTPRQQQPSPSPAPSPESSPQVTPPPTEQSPKDQQQGSQDHDGRPDRQHPGNQPDRQPPGHDNPPPDNHQTERPEQPGLTSPPNHPGQPGDDSHRGRPGDDHRPSGQPGDDHRGQPGENHYPSQPSQPGTPPGGCGNDCPSHPIPLPTPSGGWNPGSPPGFPDWGNQPPQHGAPPVLVEHHNPVPSCGQRDCTPPPVLPGKWDNQWLNDCDHGRNCQPPPNPNVFVHNDIENNVVIVNNVVNQQNTNIFVTNLTTGAVFNFPQVPYGTPYAFPRGWCGGVGGSFAWSANVGTLFAGASFAGGGVFNVNAGCGYVPYVPPPAPLIIAAPGYPQYIVDNYVQPEGCGCVYVNNTYMYGQQQGNTFVPSSWTPDIVTQPAQPGVPPYIYETGHVPSWWSQNWWLVLVLAVAGVGATGTFAWAYRRRESHVSA